MKLFVSLLTKKKKSEQIKSLAQYKEEMLVKMGRQQFRKLNDLGLTIPVKLA